MGIQLILIVILIGVAAGMLSGLVGVGGGLIIVPSLVFFLGMSQFSAQGTSLGLILLPVGILAVLNYYKQGHVDVKVVCLLSIGFIAGSYFGSKISLSLSQDTVKKCFAVFMIIVAIKMIFFDKKKEPVQAPSAIDKNG